MTEAEFEKDIGEWERAYLLARGWLTAPETVLAFETHARDLTEYTRALRKKTGMPVSDLVRVSVQLSDGVAVAIIPACLLVPVGE